MSIGSQRIFVAVAGNIGTGKTTLTKMLADHFQWQPHFESVTDNPYLADFYTDMKRWSFPLQIYFMTHRVKSHLGITLKMASAIQDRTIYEDANIFARNLFEQGLMEDRDFKYYIEIYKVLCSSLQPPDLMIYLRAGIPKLVDQIQMRGRDYEDAIRLDYLKRLNERYEAWIGDYKLGPLLIFNVDDMNFQENPEDLSKIITQVESTLNGLF